MQKLSIVELDMVSGGFGHIAAAPAHIVADRGVVQMGRDECRVWTPPKQETTNRVWTPPK